MTTGKKTFAFKLAEKRQDGGKWRAREGVSLASCTDPTGMGMYRYNIGGSDTGAWC